VSVVHGPISELAAMLTVLMPFSPLVFSLKPSFFIRCSLQPVHTREADAEGRSGVRYAAEGPAAA
jgi:hypothetical protein